MARWVNPAWGRIWHSPTWSRTLGASFLTWCVWRSGPSRPARPRRSAPVPGRGRLRWSVAVGLHGRTGTPTTCGSSPSTAAAYQLKEADPHSWALPRLPAGPAKAAFVEIQADEYGNGGPGEHAECSPRPRASARRPSYGAYLDRLPAPTLATANLMTLFGPPPLLGPASATSRVRDDLGRPDGALRPAVRRRLGWTTGRPLLRRPRAWPTSITSTWRSTAWPSRSPPTSRRRRPTSCSGARWVVEGPLHRAPARLLARRGTSLRRPLPRHGRNAAA